MCGIVGYFRFRGPPDRLMPGYVERACDTLAHRGPDDAGIYVSADGLCVLGHRRLSILDLSPAGHQPMVNEDGTLWIVFNGEIYNFRHLRKSLVSGGHEFRSRTDTEVILHLYEEEGPALVSRLDGMFAFVIYDARRRRLFGARDRLGVKPLYYCVSSDRCAFGSEPKALLSLPDVSRDPQLDVIPSYLAFNCVPGPQTLFRDIAKLQPGSWFIADADAGFRQETYWLPGTTHPPTEPDRASLVSSLGERLRAAAEKRMLSDVPFGAMLSGGIDSSLVVALMSKSASVPIKTFTVGYPGDDRDPDSDLSYARLVARTFNTDHHEVVLSDDRIAGVLDDLPALADDPVGAPSVTANVHLAWFARANGVTVTQVGEGADEVFCGYRPVQRLWRLHNRLSVFSSLFPRRAGGWLARALGPLLARAGNPSIIGSLDASIQEQLERYARGEHLHWGYGVLFTRAAQQRLFASGRVGANPYLSLERRIVGIPQFDARSYLDQLTLIDLLLGLPERLLMRVDKASMLSGVEARVPFLDPHVLDVAFTAPPEVRARRPKALLTQYALQELPQGIVERRKQGFPTAQRVFLAPKVFPRIQASILDRRFVDAMGFATSEVARFLDSVQGTRSRYFYQIWSLYILSLWFRCWVEGSGD